MNLGRRGFLQAAGGFVAGAVGGTLLSPIPWKLTDDVAIWTQNWWLRPSPERGEITEVASICLYCEGGCGIKARLVNGERAVTITGNPQHPVNRGGVCPLGASGLQFLYAPYRISQPMQQTKKRGDINGFQPISWEEAVTALGGKLAKLQSEGKAQSVACITGQTRSSMHDLWKQFFNVYGSPNLFTMPSSADTQKLTARLTLGQEVPFAFALEKASFVLSFGANLLEGWGAPGRMLATYGKWREEIPNTVPTKLVQVESRCSLTAAKADVWISVRPGTEAALALGMAHVLLRDNLYDADFVDKSVFGCDAWAAVDDWAGSQENKRQGFKDFVLAEYKPEKVAEITGVEVSKIEEVAREFASYKNAVAVWGSSNGTEANNVSHELAFLALNALVGNMKPGGLLTLEPQIPLSPLSEAEGKAEQSKASRLDLVAKAGSLPLPGNNLHLFLDTLVTNPPYPIELLMVHEANPAYSLPENGLFLSAAEKVNTVVSFSSYMDETALMSDFIFPNHCALERRDDVKGLPGAPYAYYAVASPILKPALNTMHTGDFMLAVARTLGEDVKKGLPWKDYESCLQERVKGLAASGKGAVAENADVELGNLEAGKSPERNYKDEQDLWTKLTQGSCWYDAPTDVLQSLKTESGRVELACKTLVEKGVKAEEDSVYLPHFAPLPPSGEESEYPLLLVNYQLMYLANQYLPNSPFMNKTLWDTLLKDKDQFVEIHPATAKELGMKEGDFAKIKTLQGEFPVRVHLVSGARPGVIFIAQGFGHTAYDEYIRDKGVNANKMMEVQMDPITGLGTVWATRAQLRRA